MTKIIILVIAVVLIGYYFARSSGSNESAEENIKAGTEFLEANKTVEGVKTTASGLQYLVLQQGTGDKHPTATDRVLVHYHGTRLDGTVFDSSVDRGQPISFGLNQVIKGWTEGLQLMVSGEKTRLFIPADLAYGKQGAGKIGPGATLIFDVELIGIHVD